MRGPGAPPGPARGTLVGRNGCMRCRLIRSMGLFIFARDRKGCSPAPPRVSSITMRVVSSLLALAGLANAFGTPSLRQRSRYDPAPLVRSRSS